MVRTVKEIEADLKRQDFEIYYRSVRAREQLKGWLPALIRKNEEFSGKTRITLKARCAEN